MISITKRRLVKCCIGVIYEMAPNNNPRNIDKIREYIVNYCTNNITKYSIGIEDNKRFNYMLVMIKMEFLLQLHNLKIILILLI